MPFLYEKYAAAFLNTDGTIDNIKFNIPDNFNLDMTWWMSLGTNVLTNPR
jgi:hypothetical protein